MSFQNPYDTGYCTGDLWKDGYDATAFAYHSGY